jgi:ligand-binding sensor protein
MSQKTRQLRQLRGRLNKEYIMKMLDLLTKEQWTDFEKNLHNNWGVNACAYNEAGATFTGFKNFVNPLCKEIKAHPEGIQAICSVAHQHMAKQAKDKGATIIEPCDAGLLKICTPLFINDEFVGIIGGCGRLPEGEEVESFIVHKATGVTLEKVEELAKEVPTITMEKAQEMATFLENFVADIQAKAVGNA